MTEETNEHEQTTESDELFFKFNEACEGCRYDTVVETCIDMLVACVKESEDEAFAQSCVVALLRAAKFLAETGVDDEPLEESRIQLLN